MIKNIRRSFFQRAEAVLLSAVLIVGMLSGAMPVSVLAQENEDKENPVLFVSEFIGLPEDVREQAVPVGTEIEELLLPDILEAVVILQDKEEIPEEDIENTPVQPEDADAEKDQSGQEGETSEPEQDKQEPGPEENTDEEIDTGMEETVETQSVPMQEYYTENTVTVKTLENTREGEDEEQQEKDDEVIQIQGVTWEAEPVYDGNVEGVYLFSAVLPEGYVAAEGVSLPQITAKSCDV